MELRKRASYRRACVELLETRRLLSVTIPDGYLKLNASPIDIDATSSAQVSTGITLKTGANYFFVASGTHVLAPGRAADAQFYQQATTLNWVQGGGPHLHVTGVSSWGAYQSDHIYGVQAVGNGNELRPWISDSNFSDNSGHLSLDVYASFQADLEIYKPALIDTAQGMIADADEATVGSATFVNLDNDDNDTKFDDTDDVVTGGDDELVKLTLKVKNPFAGSQIKLTATAGSGDVKLWKQNDKAAASAYTSGDAIPLADFVKVGDWFTKNLWVEGIAAQAAARGSVLKLEQVFNSNTVSDEAALTVIGVNKVEWVGYDNAIDDSNNLDADPNWPAGLAPGAKRVFPDSRFLSTVEAQPRSIMRVKTALSVAPPFEVKVHLRAFDTDDPSADSNAVDNEAGATDNRGAAGTFGWQASGVTPNADVTKELSFAAEEAEKQADYIVSMQPGDNYRLVANADKDFLLRLNNNDNELNVGGAAANANKQRIVNQDIPVATAPTDREVRQADKYTSDVLTVWRFVTVELDSMPAVTLAQNSIAGTVTDIVGSGAALTEVKTSTNLADGSNDLDTAAPNTGNGRFENGKLILGTGATAVTINPITGSGTTGGTSRLVFPAASIAGLAFDAGDTDAIFTDHNTGTITNVAKSGANFVWTLSTTSEGEADWSEFVGGTLSVGIGGAMTINAVNKAAGTMTTTSLNIPFSVTDDDDLTTLPYPTNALGGIFMTAYREAYIEPKVADTGNNTIASATLNILPTELSALQESQLDARRGNNYWVAYNLWVFQFHEQMDYDYNNESGGAALGSGRGWTTGDDKFSGVAIESARDSYVNGPSSASYAGWGYATYNDLIWRTAAHEVGHQFGLGHANGALMGAAEDAAATSQHFSSADLDLLRANVASPGR